MLKKCYFANAFSLLPSRGFLLINAFSNHYSSNDNETHLS